MSEAPGITPDEFRSQLSDDDPPLLVCSYGSDIAFQKYNLEGAISAKEFKEKLPSLSKEQKIVFY